MQRAGAFGRSCGALLGYAVLATATERFMSMDRPEAPTMGKAASPDLPGPSRRAMLVAFLLPVVLLLPFLQRAYNIDDPTYVWMAQHIAKAPLDFFGSYVEYGNGRVPMYEWNQNPPGNSYYLALFGVLGGWREAALHSGAALFAGFAALGLYLLAHRLCPWPMLATALTVLTPGFLVSAGTVMTDVPMLALYIWSLHLWIRGLDMEKDRYLAASMLCAGLGILLKYFAVTSVPLLLVYTLARRRRIDAHACWLLMPPVVAGLFLWTAHRLYGVNLFELAVEAALDPRVRETGGSQFRVMVAGVFAGGCLAPMALYAPHVLRARTLFAGTGVLALGLVPFFDGYSVLQLLLGVTEPYSWQSLAHLGLMLGAGVLFLSIVCIDVAKRWGPEALLLALWVIGTLVFTVLVNQLINARVILPMIPAVAIMLVRQLAARAGGINEHPPRRLLWPVPVAALFSLWVMAGDYSVAENARQSALRALEAARSEDRDLYYLGLWGFQYYLQAGGAQPFRVQLADTLAGQNKLILQSGDLVAVSSEGRETWRVPPKGLEEVEIYSFQNRFGVATYHPVAQAGFYSHLSGLFPYFIGVLPPEEYGLYRWTGPSYVPDEREPSGTAGEAGPK